MQIETQLAGLATLSLAQLRAEWRRLHRGRTLPGGLTSSQLIRGIAWRLQERRFGGLAANRVRELDRLAAQLEKDGDLALVSTRTLKPGTRLVRHWHDRAYSVTVLADGFAFEGAHYASLTRIARRITGAAWSGPRFFGLKQSSGLGK